MPREHAASSEEYVPFVTDFARSEPTTATEEPFVPFVSDFPKTTVAPGGAADSAGGIDWDEAAVAVGLGGGVAALLAGSGVILFRRARPVGS